MKRAIALISTNYAIPAMRDLTRERPVAAIPFGGRYRILDFSLSNIVNCGIRTVGLTTSNFYRPILDHLGAGKEWNLDRKKNGMFILPGSSYGFRSMGCRFMLRDLIKNEEYLLKDQVDDVIFTASNHVVNMDYQEILRRHQDSGADITLIVKPYRDMPAWTDDTLFLSLNKEGYGQSLVAKENLPAEEKILLFTDSFIIRRQTLLKMMQGYKEVEYMDFRDIIAENLHILKAQPFFFEGYLGRINSVHSYFKVSMDLLKPKIYRELFLGKLPIHTKIKDNPPTRYLEAAVAKNAIISSGCNIEGRVENSIIFREVTIKSGAYIKNCIIMNRSEIGENVRLENIIADKFVRVGPEIIGKGQRDEPIVLPKKAKL